MIGCPEYGWLPDGIPLISPPWGPTTLFKVRTAFRYIHPNGAMVSIELDFESNLASLSVFRSFYGAPERETVGAIVHDRGFGWGVRLLPVVNVNLLISKGAIVIEDDKTFAPGFYWWNGCLYNLQRLGGQSVAIAAAFYGVLAVAGWPAWLNYRAHDLERSEVNGHEQQEDDWRLR